MEAFENYIFCSSAKQEKILTQEYIEDFEGYNVSPTQQLGKKEIFQGTFKEWNPACKGVLIISWSTI